MCPSKRDREKFPKASLGTYLSGIIRKDTTLKAFDWLDLCQHDVIGDVNMAAAEGRRLSEKELTLNMALSPDHHKDHCQTSHSGQALSLPKSSPILSRPEPLASRAGKRLSLSLPVQAGERDAAWPTWRAPTDSEPSTRQSSPSLEVDQNSSIRTSNGFLVALAAQERKVLELKEELHRADSQLKKLKRQWALYESSRNRERSIIENTQLELEQVQSTMPGTENASGRGAQDKFSRRSLNMDIDRRKVMFAGTTKDSRRKIISGGHTRALSLLSPVQGHYGETIQSSQALNLPRAPAANGTGLYPANQSSMISSSNKPRHTHQGSATTGVKQIAEDIKSGLWTFMEDLRQATVGDEAVKGVMLANADVTAKWPSRRGGKSGQTASDQSPICSPLLGPLASIAPETEHGRPTLMKGSLQLAQGTKAISDTSTSVGKKMESSSSVDDDWSNWDSPDSRDDSGRWSNGTIFSSQHTSNKSSPPNKSKGLSLLVVRDSNSKHDEASWPALNDFMPSNIKRTASAIIREWEKSLITPSINERQDLLSNISNPARKDTEEESRLLLNNLP